MPSFLWLLLGLLFTVPLHAQQKIKQALTTLEKDKDLRYASLGVCVVDIAQNKVLIQRNMNQRLVPASIQKLLTTGAALSILGRTHRFSTRLQYDGTITNGVLKGNLYVTGGGDPTLGSSYMKGTKNKEAMLALWVAEVKKAGIKRIEGQIIGDGTYFDSNFVPENWQWVDMGNYYGAGASGLNFNENIFFVELQQNWSVGKTPKLKGFSPDVPNLSLVNEVKTDRAGTGDHSYIYLGPYSSAGYIRGQIPAGSKTFRVKGAVPDPPLFVAHNLRNELIARGVAVSRGVATQRLRSQKATRKTIHIHRSQPLHEIIRRANFKSVNLYCEALLKAIAVKSGQGGVHEKGAALVQQFWTRRGIPKGSFQVDDGSGLSRHNSITAHTMASIVRKLYIDKKSFPEFINLLPVAGESGTLKYLCRGTASAGNLHGKSGSMSEVRSYAGIVKTKKGTPLAFCIMVNNYEGSGYQMRKDLEDFLVALGETNDY